MELTNIEKMLLKYCLNKFNAKWIRVFQNRHTVLDTKVNFYSVYKRKLKDQPITGQLTFTNMFKSLEEGEWYYIPNLL